MLMILLWGMGAQSSDEETQQPCTVIKFGEKMAIFPFPLEHYGSEILYIEDESPYEVLMIREYLMGFGDGSSTPAYLIQIDENRTGWTTFFNASLQGDCDDVPFDMSSIDEYDGVCLDADGRMLVSRTITGYEIYCSHALYCATPYEEANLDQSCQELPFQLGMLLTLKPINVYAELDAEMLSTLPVNAEVIAVDTLDGAWYQVIVDGQLGWIAGDGVEPGGSIEPIRQAMVAADTNIWTQPSVRLGSVRHRIYEDAEVNVLAGPVSGYIRYDSDLIDEWYYIRVSGTGIRGWVWTGNLSNLDS